MGPRDRVVVAGDPPKERRLDHATDGTTRGSFRLAAAELALVSSPAWGIVNELFAAQEADARRPQPHGHIAYVIEQTLAF